MVPSERLSSGTGVRASNAYVTQVFPVPEQSDGCVHCWCGSSWQRPVPIGTRGNVIGPPAVASGRKSAKSAPHRPPEHCESSVHGAPGVPPPTHVVGQVPPAGQSVSSTQGWAAFEHVPARRAMRSTVYGASAEPKSVMTFGSVMVGSAVGSKIGGSFAPSGVYEFRKTALGTVKPSGDRIVARKSLGTGTPASFTRIPCQLNGTRMFPAASTVTRSSGAVGVQGNGLSAKQTPE